MERRALAPFGLLGGKDGLRGTNIWYRKDATSDTYREISLGGKCTVRVQKGDHVIIMTPGGGGYGDPNLKLKNVDYKITSAPPAIYTGSVGMRAATQESN